MSSDKGGRGVFIGNIPYGLTEEQITAICASVGPIVSFRLVYDADTGRPKGFGFAEFADADAAASAVRNLDKHQVQGRELRVDYSHVGSNKPDGSAANPNTLPLPTGSPAVLNPSDPNAPFPASHVTNQMQAQPGAPTNPLLGPLPTGADLPPGLSCPDAISKTLATLPPPQLLDILSQMKHLVAMDPPRATELLRQAPQLSYAIFQALLLMGLVDSSLIASVVESSAGAPAPTPMGAGAGPGAYGPGAQQQQPGYGGTPVPPPPQPQPQQQMPQLPPGQEDLIRQLLAMPQGEIDRLNPAERGQIMALRQQYAGAV